MKKRKFDSKTNGQKCYKEDKKKLDYCYKQLKKFYYAGAKDYYVNLEEVRNESTN